MGLGKVVLARRHAQRSTSLGNVIILLIAGFVLGIIGGFIMMSTAHSVIEINLKTKHVDEKKLPTANSSSIPIHIITTSNGSPYQNYQMRIVYATWQITSSMPGGDRFVAFTRILHRTKPDELMSEIPTFRADPLQPECDEWCEYPVSDRANAMHQFFDAAKKDPSMIKAPFLYMIESDYVFMKPLELPPPEIATPRDGRGKGWSFPFDYIQPKSFPNEMKVLWPEGDVDSIPNAGPAPMLMTIEDWIKITPDWERLAAAIESNENIKKKLGWVREMYGFSIALAKNKIEMDMPAPGKNKFISQLPVEAELGDAHAYHYTQCTIYKTIEGEHDVWKYDKRFYISPEVALKVPLIELPPPFQSNKWKFIEGPGVTLQMHNSITDMITQMNKAIATLKDLS